MEAGVRAKLLVSVLGLAAALFPAGVRAIGAPPPARASVSRLLETRAVPPTARIVSSRTTLKQGKTYRIVMTGIVTRVVSFATGTIGDRTDALYCYESFGTSPVIADPNTNCTTNRRRAGVGLLAGQDTPGFPDALNPRVLNKLPYNSGHRYDVTFRAKRTGKLKLRYNSNLGQRTGGYTVRLYGEGPASRPSGCPAQRARSGSARAAASCAWVVNFRVSQVGRPQTARPPLGMGFTKAETYAVGKVFFNAKPKAGRSSRGSPAGLLVHVDTYQSPINPFLFLDGQFTVKPSTAVYRGLPGGGATLSLSGEITNVTDEGVYGVASGPSHRGYIPRGEMFIRLLAVPGHSHDVMTVLGGAHIRTEDTYKVQSGDALRVEIGTPHPL
jgi:hypothetical protein